MEMAHASCMHTSARVSVLDLTLVADRLWRDHSSVQYCTIQRRRAKVHVVLAMAVVAFGRSNVDTLLGYMIIIIDEQAFAGVSAVLVLDSIDNTYCTRERTAFHVDIEPRWMRGVCARADPCSRGHNPTSGECFE